MRLMIEVFCARFSKKHGFGLMLTDYDQEFGWVCLQPIRDKQHLPVEAMHIRSEDHMADGLKKMLVHSWLFDLYKKKGHMCCKHG